VPTKFEKIEGGQDEVRDIIVQHLCTRNHNKNYSYETFFTCPQVVLDDEPGWRLCLKPVVNETKGQWGYGTGEKTYLFIRQVA